MISKQDQLDRITKLEKKALKLFKESKDGDKVNKMLEQVIKYEDLYEKRYGRNPNKQGY